MTWNLIKDKPPLISTVVSVKRQLEGAAVEWETTGWMMASGQWSVKGAPGMTLKNNKPTHWKKIEE